MDKRQELLEDDLEETPRSAKIALMVIKDKPGIQDTRLQKMAFLVDRIFHCEGEAESYFFGAFSEDLAEEVQTMVDDGTTDSGSGADNGTLTGNAFYGGYISDWSYKLYFYSTITGHAAEFMNTFWNGKELVTLIKKGD